MKTIILLMCMIFPFIALGQERQINLDEVDVTPPKFTGIENVNFIKQANSPNIYDYLSNLIDREQLASKCCKDGTEVVRFVISETGEIKDFAIINSVSTKIDNEVERVIRMTSGMWQPGLNNGNPVEMEKEISIAFKYGTDLDVIERKDFKEMAQHDFVRAGKCLFVKKNAKRALRHYNYCFSLLPNDKGILLMRGLCRYELNDKEGAYGDWNRLKTLGGIDGYEAFASYDLKALRGYGELVSLLK